jgi:hypothetical protein
LEEFNEADQIFGRSQPYPRKDYDKAAFGCAVCGTKLGSTKMHW